MSIGRPRQERGKGIHASLCGFLVGVRGTRGEGGEKGERGSKFGGGGSSACGSGDV